MTIQASKVVKVGGQEMWAEFHKPYDNDLVSTSEAHLKIDKNNNLCELTIAKGQYILHATSLNGLDFNGT